MDRYNPLCIHVALKRLTVYERLTFMLHNSIIVMQKFVTILYSKEADNKVLQRQINQSATSVNSTPQKLGKPFMSLLSNTPLG